MRKILTVGEGRRSLDEVEQKLSQHDVTLYSTAPEKALELLRQRSFDVVVLLNSLAADVRMPLVAKMKQLRPEVPIVIFNSDFSHDLLYTSPGQRAPDFIANIIALLDERAG